VEAAAGARSLPDRAGPRREKESRKAVAQVTCLGRRGPRRTHSSG
jgi:hypothetical protein